ncbi:MAG: hypothetical protein Q8O42_09565 [Acidobacteriota bacterium]|nr:hypothetical protein [Acidobacteriota bacterium]
MKRTLIFSTLALVVALSLSWLRPVDARQLLQGVLLSVGTPTSPTALTATGTALNVAVAAGIRCYVAVSTATTIQAVGGSCATPGAGQSIYITDIAFGTSAAAGTAADSFPTLKSGTGGTCGAATEVVWGGLTTANSTIVENLTRPIKLTAAHELCWMMSTAGSKTLVITGFVAP